MTYFHPRDFDPDQPVIEGLSAVRKFKSYVGLGSSMVKLEAILDEYNYIDLQTAVASINWKRAKIISIP